jgi:hypothetical protein
MPMFKDSRLQVVAGLAEAGPGSTPPAISFILSAAKPVGDVCLP